MTTIEFLKDVFKDGPLDHGKFYDYTLYGKQILDGYKEEILKLEEFSQCESLEFLELPVDYTNSDDQTVIVESYKLGFGESFKGKCYLLSLGLTPEMYDPKDMYKPVKDGACITPVLYDPKTFEPSKHIVLTFSPERMADSRTNPEEEIKKQLHDLLDKVLKDPEEYKVKGNRGGIVRGIFDKGEIKVYEINKC